MSTPATSSDKPRVAIETHGCKLNQADTSVLASDFLQAGFRLAGEDEPVDVYVVNTCTVTHVADRKARQALRAARRLNPNATVVATGCYAQRDPEAIGRLDEVDLVLGNTAKAALVRRVIEWRRQSQTPCAVGTDAPSPDAQTGPTRAMVKIQEGCNQVCAYCIVPRVRGRERSVPPGELISLIDDRVRSGYREVVLTGTQLGSYGYDLVDTGLADLLGRILGETGVRRLRVSSLQAQEIGPGLLSLWSDRRLCPHFHIPLQSGSERVLRRMRRRYTPEQYRRSVDAVRQAVEGVAITTDVIVGFPGETEADFQESRSMCEAVGFAAVHVFPYSTRPGTSAAHFRDPVDPTTKSRRVQEIASVSRSGAETFRKRLLGTTRQVLWEGRRESLGPDMWTGLTDNYIRVAGRGNGDLANKITAARLARLDGDVVMVDLLPGHSEVEAVGPTASQASDQTATGESEGAGRR